MLRKVSVIVVALGVSAVGFWLYFTYRVPSGVVPMGGDSEAVALISLAVAIISLLTSVVGLIQKIIEVRASQKPPA